MMRSVLSRGHCTSPKMEFRLAHERGISFGILRQVEAWRGIPLRKLELNALLIIPEHSLQIVEKITF